MGRRRTDAGAAVLVPCPMRGLPTLLLASTLAIAAASSALAQTPPFGAEFQVNEYTTNSQDFPSIGAGGVTGSFVVSWRSGLQDGDKGGIFARRFNALIPGLAAELPVNAATTGEQNDPIVGVAANDNFVIVWDSDGVGGFDARASCQRFSGGGSTIGASFDANGTNGTNVSQVFPSLAVDATGDFVVVWDGSSGIHGQRYDASGAAAGENFLANTYLSPNTQIGPDVAMNADGRFVVVWSSFYQLGLAAKLDVFGQVFDAAGKKIGSEIQINTYTTGAQGVPRVAIHKGGDFVVVWHSAAQDGSDYGVFGQRFNSAGEKVGPEFPVNSSTAGPQYDASVAAEPDGGFVVVWQSKDQDGSDFGVFGQRFDRSGGRVGTEFAVNTYTTGPQVRPRVAETGQGIAVVWASGDQDGSASGIFARRQEFHPEALAVDAHGIGTSDLNGVLEPGEAVVVEPTWSNNTASSVLLDGSVSAAGLSGPPGPSYTLLDSSASYGAMPTFSIANCQDGSPNACYAVQLGGARPGVALGRSPAGGPLRRRLETLDAPRRATASRDVPAVSALLQEDRDAAAQRHHCRLQRDAVLPRPPGSRATRWRSSSPRASPGQGELVPATGSVGGLRYNCSPGGHSLFTDVAPTDSFCRHVHYLAAQNVTLGCDATQYCPGQTITRDAMASFIAKAIVAPGGGNAVPVSYTDPTTGALLLLRRGLLQTFTSPTFQSRTPSASTSTICGRRESWTAARRRSTAPAHRFARDAMAKFIANGFGLQLYGP